MPEINSYTVKIDARAFTDALERDMEKRLDVAAVDLQGFITSRFTKGNKTGKTPSLPGEVPAVVTGTLKRSIVYDKAGKLRRRVGSRLKKEGGQSRSLALMLEYGTSPHLVTTPNSLRTWRKGKSSGGMHPGMASRPWLRPGLALRLSTIKRILGAV